LKPDFIKPHNNIIALFCYKNKPVSKFPLTQFVPFVNIPNTTARVHMSQHTTLATTKKVAVTITLPSVNFEALLKKIKEFSVQLFSSIYNPMSSGIGKASEEATSRAQRLKFPKMEKNKFKFDKKYLKVIIPVILVLIVMSAIVSLVRSLPDAQSKPTSTNQVSAPDVLSTINLDKKFTFPLKDDKGAVVGNFEYMIQSATLQKQIIVQGQRATAVAGRQFLIVNLKITNSLKKTIQLNTRDYIRIITATDPNEQLAADIHNDPVEVQAISTKFTRVGIAINESDTKKTIHMKVGEIDGTKQNIDLNFKF
jgi:hypothetical protein